MEITEFADVLHQFVQRSAYTAGQLSRLTGIPKPTILSWLDGRVQRPRTHSDMVKLAEAMHLSPLEAAELLRAAGFREAATRMRQTAGAVSHNLQLGLETAVPFQAIPTIPYFVGRQKLLQECEEILLGQTSPRFCSLQGMAGVGKTALAARLAYRLRPFFPDGVLWAQLSRSNPMMILAAFAQAYGVDVSHYPHLENRSQMVRQILAGKQALIILDDVWHGEAVQPLLPPTGECAVIVTTRRHDLFATAGMHRITVGPFDEEQQMSLELFRYFLGDALVHAECTDLHHAAALLGHLPLAVAIAASRLAFEPGWTVGEFVNRLQQAQQQLDELSFDDQSVPLSISVSYDMLPTELRQFFVLLGLFGNRAFNAEAAAVVCQASLRQAENHLRRLHGLSLVQLTNGVEDVRQTRYRLHPLVSQYATEKFSADGYGREEYYRLIAYYVDYVQKYQANAPRLAVEAETIHAVLELAREKGFDDLLNRGQRWLGALPK